MKFGLHLLLSTICLLLLSGCGIITPLPSSKYAELRIGEGNKRQLLIEMDQWRGIVTAEGYQGSVHKMEGWFFLQGDGPVYINPALRPGSRIENGYYGTVTIDQTHQRVTIDMHTLDGKRSAIINGQYPLISVNHEPFYGLWLNDNEPAGPPK